MEKICLWGARVSIFLIPVLPLYISTSMLYPYITGKNFAFRILVEAASVFWITLTTINKKYRPNNSAIVISILTFTFIAGIADILGVNPYKSFWSNYERMEGYITILHLTLYFMIIRSILRTRKVWLLFFNIILAVGFIVCLFSLSLPTASKGSQFWMEYGTRIYGTIGNPPFLAAYMLLSIFIAFITFLNTKNKYLKTFYIILILLNTVAIYFTATRGAILSGFIGLIVMSAFHASTIGKGQKRKAIYAGITFGVILCLVAVIILTKSKHNDNVPDRDTTISRFASIFSDDSVKARLDSWKMAWNGIKKRPFLGWGQENFTVIYAVNPIPFKGEQVWTDRAHNIVIEWLINAGFLGLSSYISILGSVVYTIRKKYTGKLLSREEAATIVTALFVYFIQNLFTFDTINSYFIFFAMVAYVDTVGTEKDTANSGSAIKADSKMPGMRALGLSILMLIVFSVIFYFANYRPIDESRRTSRIIKSVSDYKSFSDLLRDFKKTLALDTFGNPDVRARMEFISDYILFNELFSQDGALKFVEETVVELEKGILENYYNLEYLSRVIKLYDKIALYEPALIPRTESLIKQCMNINPRYEWLNYALSDIYKLKKEYVKMFEIVKHMADLDSLNDQKQLKLALAAIFLKKEDVANNAMSEINKIRGASQDDSISGKSLLEISELGSIVRAYQEAKDYRKAIYYLNLWNTMVPNRAKVHFNLAHAYLNLGDEMNALKEIKKAAELNPAMYGEAAENITYALDK